MKLQSILIFVMFLLNSVWSFGQTDDKEEYDKVAIFTRIGFNTMNEINLYGTYLLNDVSDLVFGLGYNYGSDFFANGLMCGVKSTREWYARKGFSLKIGRRKFLESYAIRTIQLVYGYSFVNDLEIYSGCFSGSSTGTTERFDSRIHEFGLMWYRDFLGKNSTFDWYLGVGVSGLLKNDTIAATIFNHPSLPDIPSEKINDSKFKLRADCGFTINFGK